MFCHCRQFSGFLKLFKIHDGLVSLEGIKDSFLLGLKC